MSNANDFIIERGSLKRYVGSDAHAVVPDKVKTIGGNAFRQNTTICSVRLPKSVTKIEDHAFKDCTALEQVNIPENVKSIGAEAFRNCRQLQEITFAGVPEKVGLLAFFGCWKLEKNLQNLIPPLQDFFSRMQEGKLTLEEGKKLYQFSKAKGVATIKEFDSVGMLDWDGTKYPYVFRTNENFLILPISIGDLPVVKTPIKQLPENAVVYCDAEQFNKLPRVNKALLAVQWLMEDTFLRNELADPIQIFIKQYSDDVAYVLDTCEDPAVFQRFLDVANPKSALIGKMVEQAQGKPQVLAVLLNSETHAVPELTLDEKPKKTVAELKKIWTCQTYTIAETGEKVAELTNYKGRDKHVDIPESIGKTRVAVVSGVFPAEVESVEFPNEEIEIKCSFRNCKAMADSSGFICTNIGGRCVLTDYIGPTDAEVLTVPEGVTENTSHAFQALNVRKVILPEGFVKLASSSFTDCQKLQNVKLPESLRTIGQMAFQRCDALKYLYIPEGVTEIGVLNLNHASNKNFTIYGNPQSTAFDYAQRRGLTFVEGYPETADTALMPDFLVENGVLTGYVGSGGDVEIPTGVVEIGSFAFHGNHTITSLRINGSVRMIRQYAFSECANLSSVKIGGTVKEIESYAFQFSGLRQIELEDGVEAIGQQAFGYLSSSVAVIKIPVSVTQIGEGAFYSQFRSTTLHVTAGSYAETYAKENNIPFVAE